MAEDYGYQDNVAAILLGGQKPPIIQKVNLGTIANCYAGRLLTKEDTDYDRKVCSGILAPTGWLGYEYTNPQYRPEALTTIFEVDEKGVEYKGGGFAIKGKLTKGCSVTKGDLVANWADGQVIGPVVPVANGLLFGIPFGPSDDTETSTHIELPADMAVMDILLDILTVDATETIDVGLNEAVGGGEVGGDDNGFAAAASVATAGKVRPGAAVTAGGTETYYSANTRGVMLSDYIVGTNVDQDYGLYHEKPHICDGVAKTVTYKGSAGSDTAAGKIWLALLHENLQIVGKADQTVDATVAAANVAILSRI